MFYHPSIISAKHNIKQNWESIGRAWAWRKVVREGITKASEKLWSPYFVQNLQLHSIQFRQTEGLLSIWSTEFDLATEISLQPKSVFGLLIKRSLWTLFEVLIKARSRSQLYSQWHIPLWQMKVGHEIYYQTGSKCAPKQGFNGINFTYGG